MSFLGQNFIGVLIDWYLYNDQTYYKTKKSASLRYFDSAKTIRPWKIRPTDNAPINIGFSDY